MVGLEVDVNKTKAWFNSVSVVQGDAGGGVIAWGDVGLLVQIHPRLNATAYPSIVSDPFMTTAYPFSDSCSPLDNTNLKLSQMVS